MDITLLGLILNQEGNHLGYYHDQKVVVAVVADCGVLLLRGKICNAIDFQMVVAVGVNAVAQHLLVQINRSSLCVVCCTELLLLSK